MKIDTETKGILSPWVMLEIVMSIIVITTCWWDLDVHSAEATKW